MSRYYLIAILLLPGLAHGADVSISGAVTVREGNTSVSVGYSNQERATIDEYYRHHRETDHYCRHDRDDDDDRHGGHEKKGKRHGKGMPPGLAKRKSLPPGLARNDRLPEDIAYVALPIELERELPPLPSADYIRVRVGTDFLILNKKTHVVIDIAKGLGG